MMIKEHMQQETSVTSLYGISSYGLNVALRIRGGNKSTHLAKEQMQMRRTQKSGRPLPQQRRW